MRTLAALEALDLVNAGGTLVDLRPFPTFARGYPVPALNVPFSPKRLGERVRAVVPGGSDLVLVATNSQEAEAASLQLGRAGFAVGGTFPPDRPAWTAAGGRWETLGELDLDDLGGDPDLVVLDVREPEEWETGFVPGALRIPLGRLRTRLEELPADRRLAVICESGLRSSTAATLLRANGFTNAANVPAGTAVWRRRGLPLAFPEVV